MSDSDLKDSNEIELIAADLETLNLGTTQVRTNNSPDLKIKSHPLRKARFSLINYERIQEETLAEMSLNQSQTNSTPIPSGTTSNLEPLSRDDIQLLLQSIPEYFPGENLSIFVNEVDNLCKHLEGEARDFLSFQNATNWPSIRRVLLQKYGDQRSEDLLVSSLTHCVQKINETYMQYYSRILKSYSDLIQYLTLNIADPVFLNTKSEIWKDWLLKPFKLVFWNHIEAFEKQEWEFSEFIRRTQEPDRKPQQNFLLSRSMINTNRQPRNQNSLSFTNQQSPRFVQQSQNSFSSANQQPSSFVQQSQKINLENFTNKPYSHNNQGFPNSINKPLPSWKVPLTNKKVFGTNPGSSFTKTKYQPTPMSTSTIVRQQHPHQRTFEFEELYNVETQNNDFNEHFEELLDENLYDENLYDENLYDENDETDENFRSTASESQQK
ncbi:hypothetical protein HHI36_005166 [Cryptolaemus montrouzieri]|uniref:Uncharacterized protein n=1 Tax=Cryptolaemus montrouzieri TaxID=559131 RepID=A0ABD2NTR7_9CUCU